jgi:hypothetical protein
MGVKIIAQAITETKSTAADKLIEILREGMKFDLLKNREVRSATGTISYCRRCSSSR